MPVRRALGRMESVWRCHVLSPIVPSCFPSGLVLRHKDFALVHPCYDGIRCRCCQSLVTCGSMKRRSTNVFYPVSSCRKWHGRLHIRQAICAAEFPLESRVPVDQNLSVAGASAVNVGLSPLLELPTSQRTDVHNPDQCDNRGLSRSLSITRAVLLQAPRAHAVLH